MSEQSEEMIPSVNSNNHSSETNHQLENSCLQETQWILRCQQQCFRPIRLLCAILLMVIGISLTGGLLIRLHNQQTTMIHGKSVHQFMEKHFITVNKPQDWPHTAFNEENHLVNLHQNSQNAEELKTQSNVKDYDQNKNQQANSQYANKQKNSQLAESRQKALNNPQITPLSIQQQNRHKDFSDLDYFYEWHKYVSVEKYEKKAGISWDKFQRAMGLLAVPDNHLLLLESDVADQKHRYKQIKHAQERSKIASQQRKRFKSQYPSRPLYNNNFCVIISPKQTVPTSSLSQAANTIFSISSQNKSSTIVYAGIFTNPLNHKTFKKLFGFDFPQTIFRIQSMGQAFIQASLYPTKTQTVYRALHQHCSVGSIVVLLDQGDALVGELVFDVLNMEYQEKNNDDDEETTFLVYSQNVIIDSIKHSITVGNSNFYHEQFFASNIFRKLHKLNVSPLISFRRQLFLRIRQRDLKDQSGKFYESAFSEAVIYPMLQMAGSRIRYLEEIMVHRFEQRTERQRKNDLTIYQSELQDFYDNKKPYQKIGELKLTQVQFKDIQEEYQHEKQAAKVLQTSSKLTIDVSTKKSQLQQQVDHPSSNKKQSPQKQTSTSTTTQSSPQPPPKSNSKSLYMFNVSMEQMLADAKQRYNFQAEKLIVLEQLEQAVKKLWINHRVDFTGRIVGDLHEGKGKQNGRQNEVKGISDEEIWEMVEKQWKYFNIKYNISQYQPTDKQLPFCIVIPSYQNAANNLLYRNLDSIFMQNYTNYHIVYMEDNSPDNTSQQVLNYIKQKQIPANKIKVLKNVDNYGAMYSIYHGIMDYCADDEIVLLVDGDDALVGRFVLAVVNAIFQREKLMLLYSQYLKVTDNSKVEVGTCQPFSQQHFADNSFRYVQDARVSHLKAFYVQLFKKIKIEDLTYDGKRFYQATSDRAILTPMLQMANPRFCYLPEILYEYRYDTGMNGNFVHKSEQRYVKNLIQKKSKYQPIQWWNKEEEKQYPIVAKQIHPLRP